MPNVFSAGAVIIASQHNSNFSTIASDYNGNIDNDNIAPAAAIAYSKLNLATSIVNADVSSGAAIAYSKLNLATSIVNADINASAAIVDTKLAQITTASKVSGTAITGLASLPSGAGVIPVANLPALGALTFISATTISGAATTGSITLVNGQTYFVTFNLTDFTGAPGNPILQFNGDSTGAHYRYMRTGSTTTGVLTSSTASSTAGIELTRVISNSSTLGANGSFYIQQVKTASQIYRIWGQSIFDDQSTGLLTMFSLGGDWTNAANISSFALVTSSGNMTGTVRLYKVQDS